MGCCIPEVWVGTSQWKWTSVLEVHLCTWSPGVAVQVNLLHPPAFLPGVNTAGFASLQSMEPHGMGRELLWGTDRSHSWGYSTFTGVFQSWSSLKTGKWVRLETASRATRNWNTSGGLVSRMGMMQHWLLATKGSCLFRVWFGWLGVFCLDFY